MDNFTLTSGADTVVCGAADDTVYATSATLNPGDSLTGGAGTDVLTLVDGGTFRIDQLATFTGFEKITLDNSTIYSTNLTLGTQPIEVDATGYLTIDVQSPSNWNSSDVINGDPSASISFAFGSLGYQTPTTYDLASFAFSHVGVVLDRTP